MLLHYVTFAEKLFSPKRLLSTFVNAKLTFFQKLIFFPKYHSCHIWVKTSLPKFITPNPGFNQIVKIFLWHIHHENPSKSLLIFQSRTRDSRTHYVSRLVGLYAPAHPSAMGGGCTQPCFSSKLSKTYVTHNLLKFSKLFHSFAFYCSKCLFRM